MAEDLILELKGITKIFPGVKALNKVHFQLRRGEVHALMGENGAGKSTFIKVITGVHAAEEGQMFLEGEEVHFKGPKDAQEAGIAAVYQHPTSYPTLSVTENIFMGHENVKNGMIQWRSMNAEAQKLLDSLDAIFNHSIPSYVFIRYRACFSVWRTASVSISRAARVPGSSTMTLFS